MAWRNTPDRFGVVTRTIHWAMAVLILVQLALGTRIAGMEPGLSNLWLYGLHKTIGIVALALVILRIVWHMISPPPRPISPPGDWTVRAARTAHRALYVLLIAAPLSGWIASSATGIDVMIFDRWALPRIAPVSEAWETTGFAVHRMATLALFGVVALHMMGALKREMEGDGTLTRMIRGRTPDR
jgi:cytochrome b561